MHSERRDRSRCETVGGGAVTELAVLILTPAVPLGVVDEPTGIRVARRECAEVEIGSRDRRRNPIRCGAIAELAVIVVAPAVGLSPAGPTTGVVSRRERGKGEAATHGSGSEPLVFGLVAQLTELIVAPAMPEEVRWPTPRLRTGLTGLSARTSVLALARRAAGGQRPGLEPEQVPRSLRFLGMRYAQRTCIWRTWSRGPLLRHHDDVAILPACPRTPNI